MTAIKTPSNTAVGKSLGMDNKTSGGVGTKITYRPEVTPHATDGITVAQRNAQPVDSENNRKTQTAVNEVKKVSATKSPQQGRTRTEVIPMTTVAETVKTLKNTAHTMSRTLPRISDLINPPVSLVQISVSTL